MDCLITGLSLEPEHLSGELPQAGGRWQRRRRNTSQQGIECPPVELREMLGKLASRVDPFVDEVDAYPAVSRDLTGRDIDPSAISPAGESEPLALSPGLPDEDPGVRAFRRWQDLEQPIEVQVAGSTTVMVGTTDIRSTNHRNTNIGVWNWLMESV